MIHYFLLFFFLLISHCIDASSTKVLVGSDQLFTPQYVHLLKNKRIGLITNHTAVNGNMQSTISLMKANAHQYGFTLTALFAPEHGLKGLAHASEEVQDQNDPDGIPIYSLHGEHRRPTDKMLSQVDLLVYDIQDIGSRSYTYVTTLFYAIEEAAKKGIPLVVLDRPNPINGVVIDGPMMEEKWRSFVGYLNVPYCHGMTVGELAQFFNEEYKIKCRLEVVPMKGWNRKMGFHDTGLAWIPTSPNIPEATTAVYYPMTGIMGELSLVNIGVGYTLPFKLVGAPWIDADQFAQALNKQKFSGVFFEPFHFKPFYGKFAQEECHGVMIVVTDPLLYKPVSTSYLLIGILKGLYPSQFKDAMATSKSRKNMFCKVNGTEEVYRILTEENNVVWKLRVLHQKERENFLALRKKYLISSYSD